MWQYINTIQGPSHSGGGIDMILNNLPVEVEGGELLMKHSDGRVGVVPKRHASYVKELHDTNNPLLSEYMDSLQKYGEYAQDGTIVPIHGLKDPLKSDNDIKRQVRELAPGLTSIYGNDLKYLDIYSDESYKAKEYGYGGIEFMKPWQKGVNYDDRYGYPNHSYGTSRDMIVYNPNESNIGDVVLDAVSHGFREDPRYRDVAETIIGDDLSDIDHFYKLSGMKQPYDEFSNNWIDSKIRAYIATNYDIPVSEATKADYGMEVFGDSSRKVLDKYSRDVIMKRRDMSNPFVRGAVKMQDGGVIDDPPNWNKVKATLNPKNWGVPDYTDKGSRDAAFAAARKAGEKEFMWNNQRFNTNYDGTPQQQLKETGITDKQLQNQNFVQKRLTNNLYPYSYEDKISRVYDAVVLNKKDINRVSMDNNTTERNNPLPFGALFGKINKSTDMRRMDAFNIYTGRPQSNNTFGISKYKPSISKDVNAEYYNIKDEIFINSLIDNSQTFKNNIDYVNNLNLDATEIEDLQEKLKYLKDNNLTIVGLSRTRKNNEFHDKLYNELTYLFSKDDNIGDIKTNLTKINNYNTKTKGVSTTGSDIMGNFNVSFGKDDRGEYLTYYDKWDLEPIDFGKPFEIYDRIYIKDYGDGKQKRMYYTDKELSELDINKKDFDTLALQRELSNRGYKLPKSTKKDGSFDGIWGDETKNALLDYRTKNKPVMNNYAEDGSLFPDWDKVINKIKATLNPKNIKLKDGGIIPPNAHVQSTTKNVSLRLPPKLGAGIIKKESVENIYKSSQDELKQTLLDRKRKGIESYITNLEGRFSKDEIKFLDTHYPHAKSISEKYGYDVASILAHSGTETTFNTSKYVGNNPFGIKARKDKDMNPLEPAVLAKTHEWFDDDMQDSRFTKVYSKEYREDRGRWRYEVDDYFVSNESLEDAYEKYVKFLEGNKRYSNVVLNKSDSNMFLEALGKSGYSTSDKYGETLKSNLNKVNDYIKLRELKDELDIFGIYNINE